MMQQTKAINARNLRNARNEKEIENANAHAKRNHLKRQIQAKVYHQCHRYPATKTWTVSHHLMMRSSFWRINPDPKSHVMRQFGAKWWRINMLNMSMGRSSLAHVLKCQFVSPETQKIRSQKCWTPYSSMRPKSHIAQCQQFSMMMVPKTAHHLFVYALPLTNRLRFR